jgi:hypothetical protein
MNKTLAKLIVTVATWAGPAFACIWVDEAAAAFLGSFIFTFCLWVE